MRRDGNGDVAVAFDPPRHRRKRQRLALRAVMRWIRSPGDFSIVLHQGESVLDLDVVTLNNCCGKTSMDVVDTWGSCFYEFEEYEWYDGGDEFTNYAVYAAAVTISAAKQVAEPMRAVHEPGRIHSTPCSRALLRAVGVIEVRRRAAAGVIGRAWRRAVVCPEFKLCRDRLMREFEGMSSR